MIEEKREREWMNYPNGNIKRQVIFKYLAQKGLELSYFSDGKLEMRGNLLNRLHDGVLSKLYLIGSSQVS